MVGALLLPLGMGGAMLIRADSALFLAGELEQQQQLARGGARTAAQIVERTLDLTRTVHSVASLARNYHLRGESQNAIPMEGILTELAREERSGILQIAIIDTSGTLVFSTVAGWQAMDLSDREHFRVHAEGLRTPFISVPLVGRASQRWSVQVTHPIRDERGGRFAGVVVVSVDPLEISRAFLQSHFGADALTTLARMDGTVLARSRDAERFLGQRFNAVSTARYASSPAGVETVTSSLSGDDLVVAWEHINHWPLVVLHGLNFTEIEQRVAAREAAQVMRLFIVLFSLGALVAALLLWRARRRAAAVALQAEASRREVADLVNALPGAAYRLLLAPGRPPLTMQVTEGLARLTGRDAETTASALGWMSFVDEDGRLARARHLADAELHRESVTEYRLHHADGRWVWVRDNARARTRTVGGMTEIVGVLTDITQQRALAAQAMSTAKLVTLGEMATGVAHELNQPATAIALAADLAVLELSSADTARHAKARDRLDGIVRQVMRMREIIEHFQLFGRTDSHAGEPKPVSVQAAVAGALSLVHGTLNASGVRPMVDLPDDLPPVLGLLVPLEQVLVNLLINARDAMEDTPREERLVRICARADVDAGEVVLRVMDQGCGFNPEQLSRAFEPFYTSKPPGKGTGLGLAIAYGTIRSFGGQISVGNGPAGGAELTVRLRKAEAPQEAYVMEDTHD